ncbi:hypothetical protein [Flavobacterium okayamense]|uniref:Uncharacterized protein n=1 Tax=Flavobacterium okayamense TaxID=2830782 RepID=A0ABM7S7L4_9FLAO|nr:hypothetical protein [Flavobacterium okayamense]BCY29465.1 hypothetical protein KK2020170_23330 [Flavobacterium okayamense]
MKKALLLILFVFAINIYSQTNNKNYNLPPGYKLHPKKSIIDLSFKLDDTKFTNQDYSNKDLKFLKDIPENEISTLKNSNPEYFKYLENGNLFINSLSDKVKKIYSKEELWYIFAFDQTLKEKLTTI